MTFLLFALAKRSLLGAGGETPVGTNITLLGIGLLGITLGSFIGVKAPD